MNSLQASEQADGPKHQPPTNGRPELPPDPHRDDQLATNEALMQFLYRAPIGLVQIDADGQIEMINPMSAQLLMPLSPDGNLDNFFAVLEAVAPQLRQMVQAFNQPAGSICDGLRIEIPMSNDGNELSQVLSISVLKFDESRLMGMVSDVTLEMRREQSGLAAKLDEAARVDKLTKMPNRTMMREVIQRAILRQRTDASFRFAVVFINCDRFKQINDSLGYDAGDEVLAQMADRLRTPSRTTGPLGGNADSVTAGRLGGDEFVVVLANPGSDMDLTAAADQVQRALSQPYRVRDRLSHLSVSMGIVFPVSLNVDADVVLQESSIAMVEAKRSGGGRRVRFEASMHARAALRGELENDLRRGILDNQLFVVYQPVVALQPLADRVSCPPHAAGVEALVRWLHPIKGIVSPVDFIGVAEECGAIGALGEFVLATACRQFVAWQNDLGRLAPRLLAVNLSRAQLNDDGFVATVIRVLRESGMNPAQLQLEVTESLAAQDEVVQARLQELKALGLTLALDDFGTGYSSLSSLHQLPVSTVKVDRSFVSEAVNSAHHRVLIEATVRVAASLDMGTVAEGIETEEQATLVRALGCDKGQGYLYSKPLAASDLVTWLASNDSG